MVIYELLTSASLVTTKRKTHRKLVALQATWLLKYFANKIILSLLITMPLVSLPMSVWWERGLTVGRQDRRSETRCFKSKCRSNNKTYRRDGQLMLLTSLINSFKESVTRDSAIMESTKSGDSPGSRMLTGIPLTPKVFLLPIFPLPRIILVKKLSLSHSEMKTTKSLKKT